ncbi:MAG: AI-2E family transporter [Anaerolineales bacterium]|nr:AI-2E family transporter [Anaerolineales bacterium]
MAESRSRPRWSVASKVMVTACLLALFVYLLSRFNLVVPPLILAVILAYILAPLTGLIETGLRLRRGWATLLTYLLLLGGVALVPVLVIPSLVDELQGLNLNFQEIGVTVESYLSRSLVIGGRPFDATQLIDQIVATLRGMVEPVFSRTLGIAVDVITSAIWVIFILVVSFYLIKDAARMRAWAERLPPAAYREELIRLAQEINTVWGAFFRGQIVLALVVAVIITIVCVVVGLPYALAMGALAGLLEFLPSLGHGIWLFIASLLMFSQGSTWLPLPSWAAMLIVIAIHLVFQQVDLNLLIPRIIGGRVRLQPLVVILGIAAGAALAGVLGIVLAAPTIASARIIGRYLYANLLDQDPFPEKLEMESPDGKPTAP